MSDKKENTVSKVNETKGEETGKEKEGTEDDLLRKLEEQNRYVCNCKFITSLHEYIYIINVYIFTCRSSK